MEVAVKSHHCSESASSFNSSCTAPAADVKSNHVSDSSHAPSEDEFKKELNRLES